MCLSTVSPDKPKESGYFWKVFTKRGKSAIHSQFFDDFALRRGRWLKSTSGWITTSLMDYPQGFHGFERKRDAEKYMGLPNKRKVLIRCEYTEGHTLGMQGTKKTIVAGKMRIPKIQT